MPSAHGVGVGGSCGGGGLINKSPREFQLAEWVSQWLTMMSPLDKHLLSLLHTWEPELVRAQCV